MKGDQPLGTDEDAAMDFPITELMDESACYEFLVRLLHPDGLACPHCGDRDRLKVHRRDRDPILVYRCVACRRVFPRNSYTMTKNMLVVPKPRPLNGGGAEPRRVNFASRLHDNIMMIR
jgi:Zn ribbon nucleic-acid-binding protein